MSSGLRYKVLIVEDDPRYADPLKFHINQSADFITMAVTDSETEALNLVKSGLPDAMIVDLQLCVGEGDGLLLLQQIHEIRDKLQIKPYIVVLTSVMSERTKDRLNRELADFTFSKGAKNYTPDLIVRHLRAMASEFDRNRVSSPVPVTSALDVETRFRTRIDRELNHYYIKPGNEAKSFLVDAIYIVITFPAYKKLIFKEVFVTVGKKYGKDGKNVQARIGKLIDMAFSKTEDDDLTKAYTPYRDAERSAPTPKEFISYIADKIQREDIV